jgi:uncharacterized membrane protein
MNTPIKQISHSRKHIHEPPNLAAKAADWITGFVGSWTFVAIHALWFVLWIILRFEPFPFGLLTLLVSLEAIFLSTFVMMSQNRQADRDRKRDDHEAEEVDLLFQINQTQLEILRLLKTELCPGNDAKPSKVTAKNVQNQPDRSNNRIPVAASRGTGQSQRQRKRR